MNELWATLMAMLIIALCVIWLLCIAWLSSFHPELFEKREMIVGPGRTMRTDHRRRVLLFAPFYMATYRHRRQRTQRSAA